jgi:hypothetical protein
MMPWSTKPHSGGSLEEMTMKNVIAEPSRGETTVPDPESTLRNPTPGTKPPLPEMLTSTHHGTMGGMTTPPTEGLSPMTVARTTGTTGTVVTNGMIGDPEMADLRPWDVSRIPDTIGTTTRTTTEKDVHRVASGT